MITLFGGSGFIGSHLLKALCKTALDDVRAPTRDQIPGLTGQSLGDVIYCIGITSNFRTRIPETFEANFSVLNRLLSRNRYTSITYLSSTRVYKRGDTTDADAPLVFLPTHLDDAYGVSKAACESFLLSHADNPKIIRLSNVYSAETPDFASGNFLDAVMTAAAEDGHVAFNTAPDSEKDYVSIQDAVDLILKISRQADNGVYNVASGRNVAHQAIADFFTAQGVSVTFQSRAPSVKFPPIDMTKTIRQAGQPQRRLLDDLPTMFKRYRQRLTA